MCLNSPHDHIVSSQLETVAIRPESWSACVCRRKFLRISSVGDKARRRLLAISVPSFHKEPPVQQPEQSLDSGVSGPSGDASAAWASWRGARPVCSSESSLECVAFFQPSSTR